MSTENTAGAVTAGVQRLDTSSVKLPKAVRDQLAKAEDIKKAMQERFADKHTNTGSQSAENAVVETKTTPSPKVDEAPKEVVKTDPIVQTVGDPSTLNTSESQKDAKYWEHRFKTLQGMSQAETTRLKSHNAALETRLKELEGKFKTIEKEVPRPIPDVKKYLSAEEIDTYGRDVMQAVVKTSSQAADEAAERRVNEVVSSKIDPIRQKLEAAEQELKVQNENKFWDDINTKIPNWPTINEDARFHEWLKAIDPFTGYPRQALLKGAEEALDSKRVVAMFSAFLQTTPAPQPVSNKVVPDPVAAPVNVNTQAPSDVFPMTAANIKKFYSDKAVGRYRTRPQEAEKIQKAIDAAYRAGTITR